MRLAWAVPVAERPGAPYTSVVVADAPRGLRLRDNRCGFRVLVVLGGLYGNTRYKACESNEADRHHVIAARPLVHRKGYADSRDQQRHQDDHGCRFICALSHVWQTSR